MRPGIRVVAAALAFAAGSVLIPICAGRDGARIASDGAPVRALAATVAAREPAELARVGPGSWRFDGEWRTVTCAFGALGLAQAAERFPRDRERYRAGARRCLQALSEPAARRFATRAWGLDGGSDLAHDGGHAWLGYEALALAASARAFPDDPWIDSRHRAVHRALVRRLARHDPVSLATYPGQTFPPDQAVMLAALELGGHDASAWRARWAESFIDPDTGLLIQQVHPGTGQVRDGPRGSGTALAAWALGIAGLPEGRALWQSAREHLWVEGAGFAALREVPPGYPPRMDVDSGPVVLGLGLSASGFALGAARAHDDTDAFHKLHRLAWLVGAPASAGGRRRWIGGGAVADGILLAAESTDVALWSRP